MRLATLALAMLVFPGVGWAENESTERAHWSIDVKAGMYLPTLPEWKSYYDKPDMREVSASLAYKPHRFVDVGGEIGSMTASGHAFAPIHGTPAGAVQMTLYPVSAFVLMRAEMNEDQWVVPYMGGGLTRIFYEQQIEAQGSVKGAADGYHIRAGLQLSLDLMDPDAANNMYKDYGVYHTYFVIEGRYTRAMVRSTSIDLGGKSLNAGLLFEF